MNCETAGREVPSPAGISGIRRSCDETNADHLETSLAGETNVHHLETNLAKKVEVSHHVVGHRPAVAHHRGDRKDFETEVSQFMLL